MNYVVLFQRGDRTPNIDSWHVTEEDAERRVDELKGQFDWMKSHQIKQSDSVKVWYSSS
jgi:hypothetical protein